MPAPIRIMHVVDSLGKGGLENGLVNLIDRLDAGRFEHVVCTMRGLGANAERLPKDRVRVMCLGKEENSRIQIAAVARAIREVRPAIVHSRNWAAIEAVIAGQWVRSCAVVHSEHGLESGADVKQPWRRICFRRLAYELADRVLSVSSQLRELHARLTGFSADRITIIHNGVDSRRFFPDPGTRVRVRQELGLGAEEVCIGCVGSLSPVKDHITLLRAAAGFDEVCRDWRLLVIGEGPELPKLQAFLSGDPLLEKRVSLMGSSHRVPELLQAMDIYVLPSINEGISNSLLEAMATGLPVAATATGGNPEVVQDGESGMLFPVGDVRRLTDQLLSLRASKDLRLQLGQKALRRVREDFSLDAMAGKYAEVYESVAPEAKVAVPAVARA